LKKKIFTSYTIKYYYDYDYDYDYNFSFTLKMSLDNNNSLGSNKLGFVLGEDDDDANDYYDKDHYKDIVRCNNQTSHKYENLFNIILDNIIKLFDFISL